MGLPQELIVNTATLLSDLNDSGGGGGGASMEDDARALSSGVTSDELEQLKLDTVACVNDSLFKKLHEIEQVRSPDRTACLRSIIETTVRFCQTEQIGIDLDIKVHGCARFLA